MSNSIYYGYGFTMFEILKPIKIYFKMVRNIVYVLK